MNNRKVGITTIDNPYDYFEQFNDWFMFDIEKGYYTCNKLARLMNNEFGLSQKEEDLENEKAIDRLIEIDPFDIYKKVILNDEKNDENKENDIN